MCYILYKHYNNNNIFYGVDIIHIIISMKGVWRVQIYRYNTDGAQYVYIILCPRLVPVQSKPFSVSTGYNIIVTYTHTHKYIYNIKRGIYCRYHGLTKGGGVRGKSEDRLTSWKFQRKKTSRYTYLCIPSRTLSFSHKDLNEFLMRGLYILGIYIYTKRRRNVYNDDRSTEIVIRYIVIYARENFQRPTHHQWERSRTSTFYN